MFQKTLFNLEPLSGNRTSMIVDVEKSKLFFQLFNKHEFKTLEPTEAIGRYSSTSHNGKTDTNSEPTDMEIIINAPMNDVKSFLKEFWE